ncbi:hypothetical protein GCG54_00003107 [Colletotrichum gloeosporioides]|uniref:Fungal lipase-type domain-containing protein n=1 Tax=Colletotrichum gloeosporioides TaxID=474922 RepID=A0A8H4CVW5_COLGL|nr:uncharacterized protein GCG54_00003107 [Colletotrichum gloeosporioides]KAF3810929.1 hypothetical protein GCG54_00003107 [Colletotrichum gloeosporioides]
MAIGVGENTAKLKNDLALANLERLAQHKPPSPPDGLPGGPPIWDRCNLALDLLEKWRAAKEGNISQAINAQVFGGKGPISWPIAFLPFMQSIAIAFVSTESQKAKPFASIAFKGRNSLSLAQVLVDYNYQLTKANGYFQNQEVFLSVYTSMFGKYDAMEDITYEYVLAAFKVCMDKIPTATSGSLIRTHVTGHSFGGSYSSFCYAQMLIDDAKLTQNKIQMGDECTFRCPRVGSNDWAAMNQDLVSKKEGQS